MKPRINSHTDAPDPKLEAVIVKSIAGFMNTNGGTLLIGVTRPLTTEEAVEYISHHWH